MDHNAIIARAFEITRHYKALWIFGFLAAFAGGGGGSANFRSSSSGAGGDLESMGDLLSRIERMDFPGRDFVKQLLVELDALQMPTWLNPDRLLDPGAGELGGLLAVALLVCGALLVLVVAMVLLRLVSDSALIRMVDAIEEGQAPTFGDGLELALTWRTARWFLLEILAGLLSLMILLPLVLVTVLPIALLIGQGEGAGGLGVVLAIGLVLLGVPLLILFVVAYGLTQRLWSREILVGGADMGAAVAGALGLLRSNLLSILLLWFILLVLRMIYFAISIFLFFVALFIAAAVGIAIGALIYGLGASAIFAALLGFLLALGFLAFPLVFISGLFIVFDSSAWTLAWRWMDGAGLADVEAEAPYDPDFGGAPETWRDPGSEAGEPAEDAAPQDRPDDRPHGAADGGRDRDPFALRGLPATG